MSSTQRLTKNTLVACSVGSLTAMLSSCHYSGGEDHYHKLSDISTYHWLFQLAISRLTL